jgi:putative endonuclease
MKYVYLLQSISHANQRYIGITSNLQTRLKVHNEGGSAHTSKYKPWKIVTAIGLGNDTQAVAFEGYLKSGSGRAFANKHFW